jgi:20S proteasome subunit alpha 6
VLKIDDHMGISLAGLTADARTLAKYMRTECLNHKYVYGSNMQARRLAVDLADMHQVHDSTSQAL